MNEDNQKPAPVTLKTLVKRFNERSDDERAFILAYAFEKTTDTPQDAVRVFCAQLGILERSHEYDIVNYRCGMNWLTKAFAALDE